MKILTYILGLFFLSSCSSAQNLHLIKADHTVNIGGVKGARAEIFNITVKENTNLAVKYLLVGNVKIDLIKENKLGTLHLKGQYFPEKPETIGLNGESQNPTIKDDFNLEKVFLVLENMKTKKQILQKVVFSKKKQNEEFLPFGDVPE